MKAKPNNKKSANNNLSLPVNLSTLAGGGSTYTLQEIADTLGVTRERVRQIEVTALKKLRHPKLRKKWEAIIETVNMIEEERARKGSSY